MSARRDAGGLQLPVVHLPVGGAGGVEAAGPGVGHVGGDGPQAQVLHEGLRRRPAPLHGEAHHAAGAVGQVLLRQGVVGVTGQAAVADPGHLGVAGQELRHRLGVLAVAGHADVEALQPQIQQEGVLGGGHGPEVPHELGGGLVDEGPLLPELLGVDDAVVALVGGGEAGELVLVGHPVELAPVHDTPAQGGGVAVHVLGGGVGDDVRAPRQGAAVHRGGEGVVHDEGHAMAVGGGGELLDVQHGEGRVGDGLAEDGLGVGAEGSVQLLLGAVRGDEGEVDPHLLHGHGEEVVGAAVDGVGGHHVVPAGGDVEHGVEVGRLAGGGEHPHGPALQGGDLGRHGVAGGVLQAGVEVALGLQVKELAHVLAGVVLEGGGLDNGDLPGLPVAGAVAPLDADGVDAVGHGAPP